MDGIFSVSFKMPIPEQPQIPPTSTLPSITDSHRTNAQSGKVHRTPLPASTTSPWPTKILTDSCDNLQTYSERPNPNSVSCRERRDQSTANVPATARNFFNENASKERNLNNPCQSDPKLSPSLKSGCCFNPEVVSKAH